MALSKKIEKDNGVITNYHRIVSINEIVNEQTLIEVASYTSEEKRQEEIQALETSRNGGEYPQTDIYIDTEYLAKEYNEKDGNIEDAYNYLKTLDKFKGAKDC
jgi:hypothetical protein